MTENLKDVLIAGELEITTSTSKSKLITVYTDKDKVFVLKLDKPITFGINQLCSTLGEYNKALKLTTDKKLPSESTQLGNDKLISLLDKDYDVSINQVYLRIQFNGANVIDLQYAFWIEVIKKSAEIDLGLPINLTKISFKMFNTKSDTILNGMNLKEYQDIIEDGK